MRERISSSLTFFYKFIFTTIWVGGFGLGTFAMITSPNAKAYDDVLSFGAAWIFGSAFVLWGCGRLKKVDIDKSQIIVSNYIKTATMQGSDIASVKQNRWINIRPITIIFRTNTIFGHRIVFMPKAEFRLFSEDAVVERLRYLGSDKPSENK